MPYKLFFMKYFRGKLIFALPLQSRFGRQNQNPIMLNPERRLSRFLIMLVVILFSRATYAQIGTISPSIYCGINNTVMLNFSNPFATISLNLSVSINGGSYQSIPFSGWSGTGGSYSLNYNLMTPGTYQFQLSYTVLYLVVPINYNSISNLVNYYNAAVTIEGIDSICHGDTMHLFSSVNESGGIYSWSGSASTDSFATYSGLLPDTVILLYDYNGCTASASVFPYQYAPVSGVITGIDSICSGSLLNLSSSVSVSGGTYIWSGTASADSFIEYSGAVPSIITLQYNYKGCLSQTDTVYPYRFPSISVSIQGKDTVCQNDTLNLSSAVSTSGGGYQWIPAPFSGGTDSFAFYTGVLPANIILNYTDLNGCTFADTVYPFRDTVGVSLLSMQACADSTLEIMPANVSGSWPLSLMWYNGATTDSIAFHSDSAGTHVISLMVTDKFGCSASAFDTVHIHANPSDLFTVSNKDICPAGLISLSDSSYFISNPFNDSIVSRDFLADTVAPGRALYFVSYGDSVLSFSNAGEYTVQHYTATNAGCINDLTDTIRVHQRPVVTGLAHSGCQDKPLVLRALPSYPPFNPFADSITRTWWFIRGSLISTLATDTLYYMPAGRDTVQVVSAGSAGCVSDTGLAVFNAWAVPQVVLNLPDTVICENQLLILRESVSLPGEPYPDAVIRYRWFDGTDTISFNNDTSYYPAAGSYPIHFTAKTDSGCTALKSINVTVWAKPVAKIRFLEGADTLCAGSPLSLADTVSAFYSYVWSTGDTSASASPADNTPGTFEYSLKVTDGNRCVNRDSLRVTVLPSPAPPQIAPADSQYCTGQQFVSFSVEGPSASSHYYWSSVPALTAINNYGSTCYFDMPPYDTAVMLILQATYQGTVCEKFDTFRLQTGPGHAPQGGVILNSGTLICTDAAAATYQWGYTVQATLSDDTLAGETQQAYLLPGGSPNPDYDYWVIITDSGCSNKIYYNPPAGIAPGPTGKPALTISPNPFSGLFYITAAANDADVADVTLYAADGRMLYRQMVNGPAEHLPIAAAGLPTGPYCVRVQWQNGESAREMVVKQ